MDKTSLLYSSNGSIRVIDVPSPSPVAEAVIIVICYLFGVIYNLIVTVAVLYDAKLRTSPFHISLLQVSISCLLDCLTNESFAFGFVLNSCAPWCRFSATVFHFFLLSHSSSLGLLLLERTVALKDHLFTVRAALGGVLVSWIFGLVLVAPIVAVMEVHYFPNRNACSVIKYNLWISVFSLLGFLLVWGLMTIGIFELFCYVKKYVSDKKQLTVLSMFPLSNSAIQSQVLPVLPCSKNKIACTFVFLYSILLLPLTISYTVTLFSNPTFEPNPWIDPRVVTDKTRSVLTNSLEPLFTYSRYMYNAVLPILILSTDRDIRLQSRQVFCARRNVISSFDQSLNTQNAVHQRHSATISNCNLRTPVIFATSKGLHLRRTQDILNRYRGSMGDSKSKLRLTTVFCDLTINATEGGSYSFSETVQASEDASKDRRCVRFSSQVDAISAPESRLSVWSHSNTHTITTPFVVGHTYTKM